MTFPTIGETPSTRFILESSDLANGDQDFDINAQSPRIIVMENFTLIDSGGSVIDGSGGIVTALASTGDDRFRYLVFPVFHMINAHEPWWPRPHGFGTIEKLRINKFFVSGINATGFRMHVSLY